MEARDKPCSGETHATVQTSPPFLSHLCAHGVHPCLLPAHGPCDRVGAPQSCRSGSDPYRRPFFFLLLLLLVMLLDDRGVAGKSHGLLAWGYEGEHCVRNFKNEFTKSETPSICTDLLYWMDGGLPSVHRTTVGNFSLCVIL